MHQQNYSKAIFLINRDVRAIMCTYESHENAPRTMFKTMSADVKVGDYVVVPTDTRHNMTVVKVEEVDVDEDHDDMTEIKWVVGVIGREDYDALQAAEAEAIARLKSVQKKKRRDQLRRDMMENYEDEIKALPITNVNGDQEDDDTK